MEGNRVSFVPSEAVNGTMSGINSRNSLWSYSYVSNMEWYSLVAEKSTGLFIYFSPPILPTELWTLLKINTFI